MGNAQDQQENQQDQPGSKRSRQRNAQRDSERNTSGNGRSAAPSQKRGMRSRKAGKNVRSPAARAPVNSSQKSLKSSSLEGNKGRRRRGDNKKRTPQQEAGVYDLFGKKTGGGKGPRSYRPEYNEINLPPKPETLACGICGEDISGSKDVLESLEIQRGEFPSEGQSDVDDEILAAHFQCVVDALGMHCQLDKEESIAYLGAGKFAVVQGAQRQVNRIIERKSWHPNSSLSPSYWARWRQDLGSRTLVAALSIKTDV